MATAKANALMKELVRKDSASLSERIERIPCGVSAAYAARQVLGVASMPLGDYYADIMPDDGQGVRGVEELADRMSESHRMLSALTGSEVAWAEDRPGPLPPAPRIDGTVTVAQAARMLRDMMDACPPRLRRHPRTVCDSCDRLITAAEWLTVPLERANVDFYDNETVREAVKRISRGSGGDPKRRHGDAPAQRADIPRTPLDDRMREASRKVRNGVVAYGPLSLVFTMSVGLPMPGLVDGFALLLGADAAMLRRHAKVVAQRLNVGAESVLGFMLNEQTVCSDPQALRSEGAPDLSGQVDHNLDAHVVLFVKPMAALADYGLA